jgi:hypothetical protein
MAARVAEVGYSKALNRIEIAVPNGTKSADLPAIMTNLVKQKAFARLPRGCQTCTSGDHVLVREALADVINVELDK